MPGKIVIKGAREHNLKNIDLEIPRDQLVVITGVSGSGKSTLAFDTLYTEGQRRYVESLSAYARQFLEQMERPDADSIEGLSPAIAIAQKSAGHNPRSTVGTVTEIYDYLRLLFARIGTPHCLRCGREISVQTIPEVADEIASLPPATRVHILAPVVRGKKGDHRREIEALVEAGFARVKIDGKAYELAEEIALKKARPHEIDLVVDRLVRREGWERRLADSLEIASRYGHGLIKVEIFAGESDKGREMIFSQQCACIQCGLSYPEITPGLFSFNSPHGACRACGGMGADGSAGPAQGPERYLELRPCAACAGTRLRKESLYVRVGGKNIAEVTAMSINEAREFLSALRLGTKEKAVGQRLLQEILGRLRFMLQAGLDYLSLNRPSASVSGGEGQRIRLATQLGSTLTGVCYILDEPTVGLHQRDTARLLATLKQLRDLGNTVLVVEHDPETIVAADYVIDMGPGAGVNGGEVVAQGAPKDIMADERSLTGRYLAGLREIPVPPRRASGSGKKLTLKGAREHNLKGLTVEFPIGALTCVTGVSGSGKSTLVIDTLYPAMARRLNRSKGSSGAFDRLIGWDHFDRVLGIDQGPIGRSPRSNPATYIGLFDHIRSLFAQLPEARLRGYKASRFSFNVKGGRCEACRGDGILRIEMYFLPDVYVTCQVCSGKRYNRETLAVRYKGRSMADILDLTVNQALEFMGNFPSIRQKLETLREVGLGYLSLGQPAPTLSGGEAQRIKLAAELGKATRGNSLYILDEPTTGLHFEDIKKLLDLLNRLRDMGNTLIVIEHNLDFIKCADYIVDLGPDGGNAGGEIVATGTPEALSLAAHSYTGQQLRAVLKSRAA